MKAVTLSQLIKVLTEKIEKDGDLPVYLPANPIAYHEDELQGDEEIVCVGATTFVSDDDKPISVLLMSPGEADAFS